MADEQPDESRTFRFGLRTLLLVVTGVCLAAGLFRFMALVALLVTGVLLAQFAFFFLIQRSVNWIIGDPSSAEARDDSIDS